MSSASPAPDHDELAALHALDLLDAAAARRLLDAAERDPAVRQLVRDYAEAATFLALEPAQVDPPPDLRAELLQRLPGRTAQIIPFPALVPYAIAACLMILAIGQTVQLGRLKAQVRTLQTSEATTAGEADRLRQSNSLAGLRLAELTAKDPAYGAAKVIVAWDPYQHRGVVTVDGMPAPPAGHDYQLWILDPAAPGPLSAGLLNASRAFAVQAVQAPSPGFAVSLEPAGGSPAPSGPILFAVAPAQ
jgi:anti-sigma-K factor RskA